MHFDCDSISGTGSGDKKFKARGPRASNSNSAFAAMQNVSITKSGKGGRGSLYLHSLFKK